MAQIELNIPEKFGEWLKPSRYKIASGGRGGGKSVAIARLLVVRSLQAKIRVLICRELQNSIKESSFYELKKAIEDLGVQSLFEIGDKTLKGKNGSEFLFSGLWQKKQSIKSMGGINIVFIEEASSLSKDSWEYLDPTIRAPGSEIWFALNFETEDDVAYKLARSKKRGVLHTHINFDSNPWFPIELETQRIDMLNDPESQELYDHIWMGQPRRNTESQIFRNKFCVQDFEPEDDWSGGHFGTDWGFSNDPTTLIKSYISDDALYIRKDFSKLKLDIDNTPQAFSLAMPEAAAHIIFADSASPGNISYMKRNGYARMVGAKKPKNSVKDGIARIRGFQRVVIHPDCKNTLQEFRQYSWKVDKQSGLVLAEPVDKYNHLIDALRYSLEPFILGKRGAKARGYRGSLMER